MPQHIRSLRIQKGVIIRKVYSRWIRHDCVTTIVASFQAAQFHSRRTTANVLSSIDPAPPPNFLTAVSERRVHLQNNLNNICCVGLVDRRWGWRIGSLPRSLRPSQRMVCKDLCNGSFSPVDTGIGHGLCLEFSYVSLDPDDCCKRYLTTGY